MYAEIDGFKEDGVLSVALLDVFTGVFGDGVDYREEDCLQFDDRIRFGFNIIEKIYSLIS
jgi:hypothetical protein